MKGPRLTFWLLLSAGCQTAATVSSPPRHVSDRPLPSTTTLAPRATPSVARPPAKKMACGDAQVDSAETCDDGNTTGGDGCSAACRREPARFLSWDHVLLADGSVVFRQTGQVLPGRVTLSAPEGALLETPDGLRYFHGLLPLPGAGKIVMLGAGLPPCLLDDQGQVWCMGSDSAASQPYFQLGPQVTGHGVTATWNRLRRASGPVAGVAGNIDVGCILLDRGTTTQCWGREPAPPWTSLSGRMPLGRGLIAKQIVAGSAHFCVLGQNGEVDCWGDSSWGQTGYMAEIASVDRPELPSFVERRRRAPPSTSLKLDSPVRQLAASGYESCALLENGKLWCWGDTDALAFEDPNEPTFQERMETTRRYSSGAFYPKPLGASTLPHSPIKLPSACNVKDFSLLSGQLCVSCEGGCSKCWGESVATLNVKKATPPGDCLTF